MSKMFPDVVRQMLCRIRTGWASGVREIAVSTVAIFAAATASGATIKWTGGGDGTTWGNGDNWGGTAPGAEDEARLEAPTTTIQIGSETTVSNITAATTGSANVQLSVSANLNVAGAAASVSAHLQMTEPYRVRCRGVAVFVR